MKKKILLLVAALALVMLAACGKNTPVQPTEPVPTEATEPTSTPAPTATPEPTATSTPTPTPEPTATPTPEPLIALKDVFAEHGMKCGTCVTGQMLNTPKYKEMILSNFSSVTMENAMKPDAILDQQKSAAKNDDVVSFSAEAKKILDFAKENNLGVRGHTLVWHSQTPEWLFREGYSKTGELVGRDEMLRRMDTFFDQVFTFLKENGYSDIVYAYDVANECWMEDGSMRESLWRQTIGDDYIYEAFKTAKKYAPEHIDLYYNDYNEQFKTETLVNFVESLKDADGNYLIDGVGFQAHLYTSDDLVAYFDTVDKLSALGIKVSLTELDVCLGKYQGYLPNTDNNLKTQGRFYYDLINGIFSRVDAGTLNTNSLTFWGFADRLSWRSEAYPLLFNIVLMPKYSFYGAAQVKEQAGFEE
ncbi:MAG: endo-1,4-beta-xylanase [Lachnospiraceae bacterium]|nr:endo-1,4-beta-xylanase [Lachnospiraceae bacterium]